MKFIIRDVNTWIDLLQELNNLKLENKDILKDAIKFLDNLEDGNITYINDFYKVINLFLKVNISKEEDIRNLLKVLNEYNSYKGILEVLGSLEDKYGVNEVGYFNNYEDVIKIDNYYSPYRFKKIYLPNNYYAYDMYDLKTNGVDKIVFNSLYPFIIDYRDLRNNASSYNKRVLYTNSFWLYCESLPKKEEMEIYSIKEERIRIFKGLINYLKSINKEIQIIIDNPNKEYLNDYYIRSDGELFNDDNEELLPSKNIYFGTTKILVKNAKFVLLSKYIDDKVLLTLIIAPSFYKEIDNTILENINRIRRKF